MGAEIDPQTLGIAGMQHLRTKAAEHPSGQQAPGTSQSAATGSPLGQLDPCDHGAGTFYI